MLRYEKTTVLFHKMLLSFWRPNCENKMATVISMLFCLNSSFNNRGHFQYVIPLGTIFEDNKSGTLITFHVTSSYLPLLNPWVPNMNIFYSMMDISYNVKKYGLELFSTGKYFLIRNNSYRYHFNTFCRANGPLVKDKTGTNIRPGFCKVYIYQFLLTMKYRGFKNNQYSIIIPTQGST